MQSAPDKRNTEKVTIGDLAKIVTSKNAGPFLLTIDVFFDEWEDYQTVKNSGAVTPGNVARRYGLGREQVHLIRFSDAARGFKITMDQSISADDFRSRDTYGAQQHMPIALLSLSEGQLDG